MRWSVFPIARLPTLLVLLLGSASCASSADVRGADGLPRSATLSVRGRPQAHSLSCESRSACDLLAWSGRRVGEDEFRMGLARSDNPELGFVGDVDGPGEQLPPAGYGVYERPIAARLAQLGLACKSEQGLSLARLREELAAGRPVIVWATSALDAPAPVRMRDHQGQEFLAVRGEHTFLAVGYGPAHLLLLDPAQGSTKRVERGRFERSWSALGRRAVWPLAAGTVRSQDPLPPNGSPVMDARSGLPAAR